MTSQWVRTWTERDPADRPVLICLPQAGSGCGQFSPWQRRLGETATVLGVQLPGREERWGEAMPSTIAEAVDEATDALADLIDPCQPLVVFGHSFGGLLAYEITQQLWINHRIVPTTLVVSACRAPRRWLQLDGGLASDDAALLELLDLRGLDSFDADPDIRTFFLELLRRDADLSLTYDRSRPHAVRCPLEAWAASDDRTVTPSEIQEWEEVSGPSFLRRVFNGDHYYHSSTAQAFDHLRALLEVADRASLTPTTGT